MGLELGESISGDILPVTHKNRHKIPSWGFSIDSDTKLAEDIIPVTKPVL